MRTKQTVFFMIGTLILVLLCAAGCGGTTFTETPGSLVVKLPMPSASKALFGTGGVTGVTLTADSTIVKSYGVVVFDPANSRRWFAQSAAAGTASVTFDLLPPSTYSVVVMAFGQGPGIYVFNGFYGADTTSPAFVLATGEVKNEEVLSGSSNNVDIHLYPVDVGGWVTGKDETGNSIIWQASVDVGNGNSSIHITAAYWFVSGLGYPNPGSYIYESSQSVAVDFSATVSKQNITIPTSIAGDGTQDCILAVNLGGLLITEGNFSQAISFIWPTLPLADQTTMVNSLGCFIGYNSSSDSSINQYLAYPLKGTMINLPGQSASVIATVKW